MAFITKQHAQKIIREGAKFIERVGKPDSKENKKYVREYKHYTAKRD